MLVAELRCGVSETAWLGTAGVDVAADGEASCGSGVVRDRLWAAVGTVVDKSCADGGAAAMVIPNLRKTVRVNGSFIRFKTRICIMVKRFLSQSNDPLKVCEVGINRCCTKKVLMLLA